jgi:predicted nucleotide-binding protein (sugar kinase/HSP70/actin superfamily)
MRKIIIKESELVKLIEVAMDLDIYTQPSTVATDNGNLDVDDSIEDIISKLKELLDMLKSGKKISSVLKSQIYKNLDDINKSYSNIKYED